MKKFVKCVALLVVIAGLASACGSSDDDESATSTPESDGGSASCPAEPDTSLDEELGEGAGTMQQALACAATKPVKATGAPIKFGFLNHEGDPKGSFPEYTAGVQAAVDFINNELGGVGGDPAKGVAGRPISLVPCASHISPAETISCANTVAAAKPLGVFVGLNFFGQAVYDVFDAAGVPVYVGSAISPADFTSPTVKTIGGGGGCIGVNVGQADFAVNTLKAEKVMVVWANTPPGVICYNDAQKKPLQVLAGELTPTPSGVEVVSGLQHSAVSFPPGTADLTAVATQALDDEPDVIVATLSASDCWNLINALYAVGYDPASGPKVVFNDACVDEKRIEEAGDHAKGIHFVGSTSFSTAESYTGLLRTEVELYSEKLAEYEPAGPKAGLGFVGFTSFMTLYQLMNEVATNAGGPDKITATGLQSQVAETSGHHSFGGFPISCADAPAPYVSLCNTDVQVTMWTGDGFEQLRPPSSPLGIVAGTKLDVGS